MTEPKRIEIAEANLAKIIGVERKVLSKRRKNQDRGVKWDKAGVVVVWLEPGIREIEADYTIQILHHAGQVGDKNIMTVVKHALRNQRVLIGRLADGKEVTVKVRDNKRFSKSKDRHGNVRTYPVVWDGGFWVVPWSVERMIR